MTLSNNSLLMPPRQYKADGSLRRLGVELEMNGISIDQLAELVAGFIGGKVGHPGRYERVISGDAAGDWQVELDFALLKKMGREARSANSFLAELEQSTEEVFAWFAETVVPVELVSPPLPLDRLSDMESLIDLMRRRGARGTSDRITNAFGMHLNPELPDLETNTITALLKAFFCLYDWLHERASIDMTRRMTPYIDPFAKDYVRLVTAADYWPNQTQLIDDYLLYNPTRNRAMDMLPLFAFLDKARVHNTTADPRIKARPTLHYRMPNCDIHLPEWGLHHPWNDWVMVERLAENTRLLNNCCQAYHRHLHNPLNRLFDSWLEHIQEHWLAELEL